MMGAMGRETQVVRKHLGLGRVRLDQGRSAYGWRYAGKDLLVVETGPGRRMAVRAAASIMRLFSVTAVVSFGFAGGLSAEVAGGDVVFCRTLHDGSGSRPPLCSDEGLLSLASGSSGRDASEPERHAPSRAIVGSSVTVDRVVTEPAEKRALGKAFGAETVDMEGYWVAEAAHSVGVPFLAVRAVSDPVGSRVPPFDRWLGPDGRWLWGRAALDLLGRPVCLALLPAFYANVRLAEKGLAWVLPSLVARM